jgi:anti-sigma-K factor RskA
MKRCSTELVDALALDEALGVLRGSARRRYVKRLQSDEAAARARRGWKRRLLRLIGAAARVAPPPSLREKLNKRLRAGAGASG